MVVYRKESLELLRQKIQLEEVLSPYLELKKSGGMLKALCPFHDEKTPSFGLQRGDSHYHCFGCGAHGDAIAFLMNYLKMSFSEAVESLATKFHVTLEFEEDGYIAQGPAKSHLREVMDKAARFYHFCLLYTTEGEEALSYLYQRGIDQECIRLFGLGFAPKGDDTIQRVMKEESIPFQTLIEVGLVREGKNRDFFQDRIMFPIKDIAGHVIGFSARKLQESGFGPKYINTAETTLFKKSQILYGLSDCRRRIAKERQVILVEGQIDTLRLIYAGFDFTVAAQGTAFGVHHVKEIIQLGVRKVYIAFDGDEAGRNAATKVGDLLQKEGVDVFVINMPIGQDPDQIILERGTEGFLKLMDNAEEYLAFAVKEYSKKINIATPSGKNELVGVLANKIRAWDHPLMVHESLKKLAVLTGVPEKLVGVETFAPYEVTIKKVGTLSMKEMDTDRILEMDFLRLLILFGQHYPNLIKLAGGNITLDHIKVPICKKIYQVYNALAQGKGSIDLLSLTIHLDGAEEQIFLSELLHKKVNPDRAMKAMEETILALMNRRWMEQREEIRIKIQSGVYSESDVLHFAKEFDELKKAPPKIIYETFSAGISIS